MEMFNSDALNKLHETTKRLQEIASQKMPDYSSVLYNIVPPTPTVEIDEKSTFAYQMQQQTNQIIEKSNEQIKLLNDQNQQLKENYQKLQELYSLKDTELSEAKSEAKKAKRYNTAMLLITIVSMLVAIAAWLIPN